jgi:uncharacterized membrane protein HdeD (DUF308 family)
MKNKNLSGMLLKLIYFKGFVLLLTGLILVIFPQATLTTLIVIIGIYWFIDGILTIFRAFKDKESYNGWTLFSGILGVLAGILILAKPYLSTVLSASLIMWFIGISALIYGVSSLFSGIKLPKNTMGKSTMIFGGLFSIIVGVALMSSPYFSALTIINIIGIVAIIGGVSILFLAYSIYKNLRE